MLTRVDTTDLEAFYRELYPRLARFVFARTGAPALDVEDIVQETILSAWGGRAGFHGEAGLETWVWAIARNKSADYLKGRKRQERRDFEAVRDALARMEHSPIPQELIETADMRERVESALSRMEEHYARVLVLRYLQDLPVRRIAEELGESESAVESRLTRARDLFRKLLGEKDV